MTTQASPSTVRGRRAPAPRWRLRRGWRRTALVVHVISAGAWIGIDVVVAVLVLTARLTDDPATEGLAYRALATFVVWPMLVSALVCLASGLVLGLATKWGLVRYWWVAVKLVLNLLLCTLIVVLLQPSMDEVQAYGETVGDGRAVPDAVS